MKKQEKEHEQRISQEILYKLSIFEKNIEVLNQELQLVEKSIIELDSLSLGMDEIKDSVGKDILAQLGRGIFMKTRLISEEMIVDVGGKNFVKKSIPETKKIIKEQMEKLHQIKKELEDEMEQISKEITGLILNPQVD